MQVLRTTAVWGTWHIDAYLRVTLPTLLAEGNFPALGREHDCQYRVFTTAASTERIESAPGMAELRKVMPVDIRVMARDDKLASDAHLTAWQQAVDEAIVTRSAVVSVHPDTPWSNGSFAFMSRALSAGKEVLVVPNVRVISETLVPVLEAALDGDKIELSGIDMSALALRHLHPLSVSMVPQVGYSASATEIYWGVAGHGLLLRHASRPAIAAVPSKVPLDIEFYTRQISDQNVVFNVTDVNQMFMLSLAPLFKDFGLITLGHKVTPLSLGRWCAHPQNDTPLKDYFAAQSLRLPNGRSTDEASWRREERSADAFMKQASVDLAAVNLHYALRHRGCKTAAGILSLALAETELATQFPCPPLGRQGVALAPNDVAFAEFGLSRLEELLAPGNEKQLSELLRLHYRPDLSRDEAEQLIANAGIAITATTATDRVCIFVIDRVLTAALLSTASQ